MMLVTVPLICKFANGVSHAQRYFAARDHTRSSKYSQIPLHKTKKAKYYRRGACETKTLFLHDRDTFCGLVLLILQKE